MVYYTPFISPLVHYCTVLVPSLKIVYVVRAFLHLYRDRCGVGILFFVLTTKSHPASMSRFLSCFSFFFSAVSGAGVGVLSVLHTFLGLLFISPFSIFRWGPLFYTPIHLVALARIHPSCTCRIWFNIFVANYICLQLTY